MTSPPFVIVVVITLLVLLTSSSPSVPSSISPVNPRCQYLDTPLGVDVSFSSPLSFYPIRFSWELLHHLDVTPRGAAQTAYHLLISDSPDTLDRNEGNVYDSNVVASDLPYAFLNGTSISKTLLPNLVFFWKVMVFDEKGTPSEWSNNNDKKINNKINNKIDTNYIDTNYTYFSTGFYSNDAWSGQFIGVASLDTSNAPWARGHFYLQSYEVELVRTGKAVVLAYLGSVGYHHLYINGQAPDESVLSPSISNLLNRVLYRVYDVSSLVMEGDNVIGVWFAPGWSMFNGINYDFPHSPLFISEVHLVVFGQQQQHQLHNHLLHQHQHQQPQQSKPVVLLVSDSTWKVHQSTIKHYGLWAWGSYGGDIIDTRLDIPSWNSLSYDDHAWKNATVYSIINRTLSSDLTEPTIMFDTVVATSVVTGKHDDYLVNMKELFTGWIQLTLPAETIQYYPCNSTINISLSTNVGVSVEFGMEDQLILDCTVADKPAVFRNRFSYHEIQFVTITGLLFPPKLSDVVGYKVGNKRPYVGDFTCSNKMLNTIYKTTLNTYEGLTTGAMTVDCPHRERLGYGGDAHTTLELVIATYPSGAIYRKIARDWADMQVSTGEMPHTAPVGRGGDSDEMIGGGGPAWPGFAIIMPWHIYEVYGDVQILQEMFGAMGNLISFFETKIGGASGLMETYDGYWGFLGDWVTPHGSELSNTPEALLFNNCYLVYCMRLMSNISHVLGDQVREVYYSTRADELSLAIHKYFYIQQSGVYLDARQTHIVMPLIAGVVPMPLREGLTRRLEVSILVDQQGHLDTGLHGTYFMTKLLTMINRNDLIATYALQTTFPSYGYLLMQNYTTWPELWPGAGSRMHGCLNGIGLWFPQGVAGFRALSSTHWILHPGIESSLEWANSTSPSVAGPLSVSWRRLSPLQGVMALELTVPPTMFVEVFFPVLDVYGIFEGGRVAVDVDGVKFLRSDDKGTVLGVVSGNYDFRCKEL